MLADESQLKVEIKRITFRADDTGYTVFRAIDLKSQDLITGVGNFPSIHEGETLIISGKWSEHPKFGKQLKVTHSQAEEPTSRAGITSYLSSGLFDGIGEKTATKLVKKFGLDTLTVLDQHPERLQLISGLGKKAISKILGSWRANQESREVLLFLSGLNIPLGLSQRIIKVFGLQTIAAINENPYQLIKKVPGIGFLTADKIARSVGIAPDAPQRIEEATLYQLRLASEWGHCYLSTEQLIDQLVTSLQLSKERILELKDGCFKKLELDLRMVSVPTGAGTAHYPMELFKAEQNAAQHLQRIQGSHCPTLPKDTGTEGPEFGLLSEAQRQAVLTALSSKVFILTGGPGVGKTTTANTIIRLFRESGRSITLGAPTGRAAQRLSEVSQMPAKTIHRLLDWSAAEYRFLRNEDNPIPSQVVIIDESSMLDIHLAAALFSAVGDATQLILIGDVDQLPAVGPGNVLQDLINSQRVPTFKLIEVFRQAAHSHIVRNAHEINRGQVPDCPQADPQSDCLFWDGESAEQIKAKMRQFLTEDIPSRKWNPIRDVQILTPMNRGELGTIAINQELQALFNPLKTGERAYLTPRFELRPGDKVIQLSNNYDLSVFNGDIGYVVHTHLGSGSKVVVRFGGDRDVHYDDESAMDLSLAYAISIHKSQGSEFPIVIIPISMQHFIMLERNLIYTGLTRARKLALFVGTRKALAYAVKNVTNKKRQSRLCEILICN